MEELFGVQVGPAAGFGDHVIGELERRLGRDHRAAAMRDIGEGAAVNESRIVLESLDQVRMNGVPEQDAHRARRLEARSQDRPAVAVGTDDDAAEAFRQIGQVFGQAQGGHDLGGGGDIEPVPAGKTMGDTAQRGDDLAKRPVIDVEGPFPGDAPFVDAQVVAPVDVIVDERSEQIVGGSDGVEIAGEVQVDVHHRHDLGTAAAGGAAFKTKHGSQRRPADTDDRLLADADERIAKSDHRCRLAFAGRLRGHPGDQDQFAVGAVVPVRDEIERDLGLVEPLGHQPVTRNAKLGGDLGDRFQLAGTGNLDVGFRRVRHRLRLFDFAQVFQEFPVPLASGDQFLGQVEPGGPAGNQSVFGQILPPGFGNAGRLE